MVLGLPILDRPGADSTHIGVISEWVNAQGGESLGVPDEPEQVVAGFAV